MTPWNYLAEEKDLQLINHLSLIESFKKGIKHEIRAAAEGGKEQAMDLPEFLCLWQGQGSRAGSAEPGGDE